MYEIEMHAASEEFTRCWQAAGRHIQRQVQGPFHSWLKANLHPPFLEHLSFRLGNQLFFIRIEDADGKLEVPGSLAGLQSISDGCKGHACLLPMRQVKNEWAPAESGWGLVDLKTEKSVDPVVLVTDDRIEMTDWELHDFAVQIVRDQLEKQNRKLMSWQGNPAVDPSIWFIGDHGPEWVVVRATRYPHKTVEPPENWQAIAERCARIGKSGHFALVSVANADDAFDQTGTIPPTPLWRGHRMVASFDGIIPGPE